MQNEDNCWECNGKLKNKRVDYSLYGISLGKFPAQVCEKCNETYFSEEVSKKITKTSKEKGLWGLGAKTRIGQVGTTLDIRLTRKIIDFMKLKKGEEVTVYPENRRKLIVTV